MSEGTTPLAEPGTPVEPPTGVKRRAVRRWARRVLAVVVALVAALFVTFFTIDLGRLPGLRQKAEQFGSQYLERPLHIGRISARVTPGDFVIENVVIEGLHPGDRPFMHIGRIDIHVPWWTLVHRQLHVTVRLTDWQMVVESWPGDIHNVPRLTHPGSSRRRSFTTTVDFVYAHGGTFTYEDHAAPWSVVAPNLDFDLVRAANLGEYVGHAGFSGGTVRILDSLPMATAMTTRFVLDGSHVRLEHIDLVTDGSRSHLNGDVDFSHWPDQTYNVQSEVDFARMRSIFFQHDSWSAGGTGTFTGVFRLTHEGPQLVGDFESDTVDVDGLGFPDLHGSLAWTHDLFAVTHADSRLLGGHTRFSYALAPLNRPGGATARFEADYEDANLFGLDRIVTLRGIRLAGTATGHLTMEWQNGRFSATRRGEGHTTIAPPPGIELAPVDLPDTPLPTTVEPAPFDPNRRSGPLTVGAELGYRFDQQGTTFDDSWAATPHTYVAFHGRFGRDDTAEFPFHVTSHDWQESDRLLAAIMTAVSGQTGAVAVGGRGTFDGMMTGSFRAPRITGHFVGEALRVWDVTWGRAVGNLVIQNGYVDIAASRVTRGDGAIVADGRYSLGFRRDDAPEIDAHVTLTDWPLADLRHAFVLDGWPVDGTVGLADLDLTGRYRAMFGAGRLRIDRGMAWHEKFDTASGDLVLEGTGLRISRIEMHKGPGLVRGAARIGWDGTYAFNADGEDIPVESLDNFKVERAPLTGRLQFKASGAGEFDHPSYSFDGSIDDLFAGDEGIGPVAGRIAVNGNVMTIERIVAASSRLQLHVTGTVGLDDDSTADLHVLFQDTAIDPYLKFVMPDDVSPYTRVVVGGSVDVRGPLTDPTRLDVDATIDHATLTLFDYDLRNDGPVRLRFEDGALQVDALKFAGADTNLTLAGGADVREQAWDLTASGNASLAILQLFFKGLTASGGASLNASLTGSFEAPRLTGSASITNGRLRPLDSPHSLEAIDGQIEFGANAINIRHLTGRIGSGDVTFGGNIALDGYRLAEYNLTARGRSMRLRYPDGFNSTVDMDLFLTGPASAPRLTGNVDVLRVSFVGQAQPGAGLLGLAAGGSPAPPSIATTAPEGGGLALNIQVTAPRMAFIDNKTIHIEGTADLQVRGTFDAPVLTGTMDITGGEAVLFGNRYYAREGSIDFSAANNFQPSFDLSAETRPRVSGQTYTVDLRVSGTFDHFTMGLSSDPWLPDAEILSLLLGGTSTIGRTAEQQALQSSQELRQRMVATMGAVILTSPLSSAVGSVVEKTGALDTVQITPVLTSEAALQQLNPSARVTLGKRISPRVFLTYSRTLSGPQEEIILLEYDQSDRLSWVLSRNEDRSFALDFRIRYAF